MTTGRHHRPNPAAVAIRSWLNAAVGLALRFIHGQPDPAAARRAAHFDVEA